MKKGIIFLLIMITCYLGADIEVLYTGKLSPEIIAVQLIDGQEYFQVYELNKALKAQIRDDVIDHKLKMNIYREEVICLLESSYLQFQGRLYNCRKPIRIFNGKYYLPVEFLLDLLPLLYPDRIQIRDGKLLVEVPADNYIRKIVIDPGHGGKDPGAIGYSGKNYEKDIVLKIARKVKKLLEEELEVEIVLTRDKDEFVSLQERTQLANSVKADLFLSLHCNAHANKKARGIEVYYLSTAKTDEARAVEALENSVVYDYEGGHEAVKRYDDLAFILADMAQSEHLEESYQQAFRLQRYLVHETEAQDRGVKQANFYVLRGAFMPAVLLEMGYLTNPDEEKKIIQDKYQDKLASAITMAVKEFKIKYDNMQ